MKVLITGATGFIGKHLVSEQIKKGHEIHCLIRRTSDISDLKAKGVNFIYGDMTDSSSLDKAVVDMDYIYHLAIAKYPKDIDTYYQINHIGTKNLLRACYQFNAKLKKFIYVSSLAAAGFSSAGNPLNETDPPHPVTHYGKSKLKGEECVLQYKNKLPIVILRPPTVYGCENMFLQYIINLIDKGIKPIWEGYTSLCYIDDFINGLTMAAEYDNTPSDIYFISDGKIYSWEQIIDLLTSYLKAKTYKIYIPHIFFSFASTFMPNLSTILKKPSLGNKLLELKHRYWTCNSSKISDDLNFECKFSLEEGLKLIIENHLKEER